MEVLISIWLRVGLVIYWIVWLGSMYYFNVQCSRGVLYGFISWIIWLIVAQILLLINKDGWIWEMF